ncbi:MAG: hypothetical protein E7182_02820 [Erysipelotrichaceae bacterium]|nr:hypothetical protein [Erysipelotrichaceae bacterium]
MKRILLTTAAALLGLGALGFASSHAAAPVQADCDTDLSNKLLEYVTGGYTKLTTMFLTEDAQKETQYFHAGANTLQRATYYNAGETALLMGNYDGTFGGVGGATGINSGYRNDDEEGVTHFVYTDDAATEANLFEAAKRTDGWKASGQRLGTYYRTLTQLSNSVKGTTWEWDSTYKAWFHSISKLTITDGEYSDPLLKDFQYFAAPMMLQNSYFSWSSIRVTEASNFLSIRLYGSSSDAGKSTVVGEDEALISEARVFKGIHFAPKPETQWVIRGINGWEAEHDIPLVEFTDIYAPEQYTANTAIGLEEAFKIVDKTNNTWLGFSDVGLGSDAWFYSSGANGDIGSKLDGEITLWWQPTRPHLWISVNKANVTFEVNVSSIDEGKAVYVIGNFTDPEWQATAAYKLTLNDGKWVGTFELEPGSYAWQPAKADATNPTDMEKHSGASDWNFSFNDKTHTQLTMTWNW